MRALCSCLKVNNTITTVNFTHEKGHCCCGESDNYVGFGTEEGVLLADAVALNKSLTRLSLGGLFDRMYLISTDDPDRPCLFQATVLETKVE